MASPTGGRSALEPGDLLAGRYRLLAVTAHQGGSATVWRATDEILARPVAVKALPGIPRGRGAGGITQPFLDAAGRAGGLSHPVLARVYDAAREERPGSRAGRTVDVAYVISEWVEGRTLTDALRSDGPFEPGEAVRLAQDAAGALAAAHDAGVAHGRLHPGNVMITPSGRLRITDAAVAAAVHGDPLPTVGANHRPAGPEVARDARDLAAVLYAMLTARWPATATPQPAAGLAPAPLPGHGATVYAPRQVQAGVPRSLDAVVLRALDPSREPARKPLTTPQAIAQALDEAGPELRAAPPAASTTSAASPARRSFRVLTRYLPRAAAIGLVLAVGVSCYALGKRVGQLPRRPGTLEALSSTPTPGTALPAPGGRRIDLTAKPVVVRDYDPFGSGSEHPESVSRAVDGDPRTAWVTAGYSSARFGGLKPGVGLLVDLARPTRVAGVTVSLVLPGAAVQLRSTDQLGDNADAFTTLAATGAAGRVTTLTPSTPTVARYWLVWFTSLPRASDGRYRDGIAELVFTRAAA